MKRILCILISLMLLPCGGVLAENPTENWIDYAADSFAGGTGDKTDPYEIGTAEQLAYLAKTVNDGEHYEKEYFKLVDDIDLKDKNWTPIGSYTKEFMGLLDGDNKTISNLTINAPNDDYVGLFGYVDALYDNIFPIQQIVIIDANVVGKAYVGILAGTCYANVKDCSISGKVEGRAVVGGAFGLADAPTISNCISDVDVISIGSAGGLIGHGESNWIVDCTVNGTVSGGSSVGGLVGSSGTYNFKDCTSNAEITGTGSYVGGLIGDANFAFHSIENSYTTGNITANGDYAGGFIGRILDESNTINNSFASGNVQGKNYVGGFIGSSSGVVVSYCFVIGNVTAFGSYAGGFIGFAKNGVDKGISYSYATGDVTASGDYVGGFAGKTHSPYSGMWNSHIAAYYCYSSGKVTASGEHVGGFVGEYTDGSYYEKNIIHYYKDVYGYFNQTLNPSYTGDYTNITVGAVGKTTEEMKTYDFAKTALGTQGRADLRRINEGYPILEWQIPEKTYWTDYAANGFAGGDGLAEATAYEISSPEQFAFFAKEVNGGNSFEGKFVKITKPLELSAHFWVPIGNGTTAFWGSFDGGGFEISNLTIDSLDESYQGLFGRIAQYSSTPVIKDVKLTDVFVLGNGYTGGLIGSVYNAKITGCFVSGQIVANGANSGGLFGSLLSDNGSAGLEDCHSDVIIKGTDNVGGICGQYSFHTTTNCTSQGTVAGNDFVGGLIGYVAESGTISHSSSSANVIGTNSVGGLIGQTKGATCKNLYATGNVTASGDYAGGLIGICQYLKYDEDSTRITDCYATGVITAAKYSGGLVGFLSDSRIETSYATGDVSSKGEQVGGLVGCVYRSGVSNSYSRGTVHGIDRVGGFAGTTIDSGVSSGYSTGKAIAIGNIYGGFMGIGTRGAEYMDCFYSGTENPDTVYDPLEIAVIPIGQSNVEMQTPEFVEKLNARENGIWAFDIGINDGYPILLWQLEELAPIEVTFEIKNPTAYYSGKEQAPTIVNDRRLTEGIDYSVSYNGSEDLPKSIGKYSVQITLLSAYFTSESLTAEFEIVRKPSSGGGGTGAILVPASPEPISSMLKGNAADIRYMNAQDNTFRPDEYITRYEMISALYNLISFDSEARDSESMIELFTDAGIIEGYEDGTFRGENSLTRAEFTKIMAIVLECEISITDDKFPDIKDHWAKDFINSFADFGYLKGYEDGTFRPDNKLTRAEFVTVVNRIIGKDYKNEENLFADVANDHWALENILAAVSAKTE